jgi:CheY-like chemotaxis protein
MESSSLTALVVTGDRRWRGQCVDRLLTAGCDVHTASDGLRGINLLRKQIYDLVVVDDSLKDVSPLEFTLNLRELTANAPVYIIAGVHLENLPQLWRFCRIFFVGSPDDALARIDAAIERATLSATERPRAKAGRVPGQKN